MVDRAHQSACGDVLFGKGPVDQRDAPPGQRHFERDRQRVDHQIRHARRKGDARIGEPARPIVLFGIIGDQRLVHQRGGIEMAAGAFEECRAAHRIERIGKQRHPVIALGIGLLRTINQPEIGMAFVKRPVDRTRRQRQRDAGMIL